MIEDSMNMQLKFEICDPDKSALLGVRMKKGKVFNIVDNIAIPTDENEFKISFGFLLFKIDFIFKYDNIR